DLADAVFVNKVTTTSGGTTSYADMNLAWAGLANLSDIKLPTSTEMKDIPESCCEGMASLKELCIPHNYENIHNAAFLNTIIEHITTTDAQGMLVDNGPNTYTLSANVKQIGDAPATPDGLTATQTVFPQNRPVYDCYVLATKTPICYKNAFPANMLYGWGGFDGTLPYCRDKYVNGTNYYCVLRFPSQESYDNVESADKKDTSYDLMKKQYTDVTKVYSKKEQTGAVDANGDEITWPTFSELRRAYNQATAGITWNQWEANYDGQQEVNGGENIPTAATGLTLGHYTSANGTANNDLGDYEFPNYEGWHQFTLSQATYVDPDETLTREYEDAGWFTFCIPYDMTMKQVREWLGVPASEGNVHCYYNNAEVTTPMMPDIRMLASVIRHTSTGAGNNNKVTFRLSTNLYYDGAGHFLGFNRTAEANNRWNYADAAGNGSYDFDSKPCLRGGIPYIIKTYKRKGEKIKSYNLGQYIMTHYGDKFKLTQACLNHGNQYYEYLGTKGEDIATLKFSKPYEEAVVVAANDAQSASFCIYMDGDTERPYEYALVGTFWNQKLPRYCFYQSKGIWYRNTNENNYQWSAYKCVIMAVPTVAETSYSGYDGHNGQNYRVNPSALGAIEGGKSFYPSVTGTDKLNGTLKIVFADGRDDDDFPTSGSNARYAFAFDDGIMEYDENGEEVTAIDRLDGGDIVPTDGKVYNMAGQYVGNNLNALGSGLYIVNGKKIVVK
nr:leucine-rich repeat domain-containing protein [Prevotella sp.]